MADYTPKSAEQKEAFKPSPEVEKKGGERLDLPVNREGIAHALGAEGAQESSETAESTESREVRETVQEGGEVKGDGAKKTGGGKKDDKKSGAATTSGSFTFDEHNLPPAPQMIRQIELVLRGEIRELSKAARQYRGGFLHTPDYPKLTETVREIRKKEILLKRLLTMAYDALKKIFIQMFAPKKA